MTCETCTKSAHFGSLLNDRLVGYFSCLSVIHGLEAFSGATKKINTAIRLAFSSLDIPKSESHQHRACRMPCHMSASFRGSSQRCYWVDDCFSTLQTQCGGLGEALPDASAAWWNATSGWQDSDQKGMNQYDGRDVHDVSPLAVPTSSHSFWQGIFKSSGNCQPVDRSLRSLRTGMATCLQSGPANYCGFRGKKHIKTPKKLSPYSPAVI